MDRGYKKPDTNMDIRSPIFILDNLNRKLKLLFVMKQIPDIKNLYLFQKKLESEKHPDNPDTRIKVNKYNAIMLNYKFCCFCDLVVHDFKLMMLSKSKAASAMM